MLVLTPDELTAIFTNDTRYDVARAYPMYPLLSPGMPPVGPNFAQHAKDISNQEAFVVTGKGKNKRIVDVSQTLRELYLRALYDDDFTLPVFHKGVRYNARLVPGHIWGGETAGPVLLTDEELNGRKRVMVVGKLPGDDELSWRRNMVGPTGQLLRKTLLELGLTEEEIRNFYVCNLVRWQQLGAKGGQLAAQWIKDCLPILHQEFRLVRPDVVLCLGAEATKAICGAENSVGNMISRSITVDVPLHEVDEDPVIHHMEVLCAIHPAAVLRATELTAPFEYAIHNFIKRYRDEPLASNANDTVQWRAFYDEESLSAYIDVLLAHKGLLRVAIDAEWQGHHPGEPGAYLRTIQFSADGRNAAVVVLRHAGGEAAFTPGIPAAINQLNRLLAREDLQIGGSFFSSDLPWLEHAGLHIAARFTVPQSFEEFYGGNYSGGFDVGLAYHAYDETADFGLEVMATKLCGVERWDIELANWYKQFCNRRKLSDEEAGGYGECPAEILHPYGAFDALYTRRLMDVFRALLYSDRYKQDCWTAFHTSMLAFPAFNEMGTVGVMVDRERIDELTDLFETAGEQILEELRRDINWPGFNPRSPQQCVEFLFGEQYSTKLVDGERVSVRPKGATSLYLSPIKSTSGRSWDYVTQRGEEALHTPCTDKETCGILGAKHPLAMRLRDVRLVDQVLKSVLKRPHRVKGVIQHDGDGNRIYNGGVAKYICHDGRVRSNFTQIKETGRASSARPPLQNISNRREDDYRRILGADLYKWPIRSFITSSHDECEPTVLVEADYTGAELFVMAVMTRDPTMLDHCLRANLPDGHPDQYDIHSNVAVNAFRLNCAPTKKALQDIGKKNLRINAKNVLFGINYGSGAESCTRRCKEEGANITVIEAQQIINTIFTMYPGIQELQAKLRARAHDPCWLRTCFGRLRRCIPTEDWAAMGELERQFLNFPFQSTVADAVSIALNQLFIHPRRYELGYKIVLQIHDAIVLEVPVSALDEVYDDVLPKCMIDNVSFKSCDLNGEPYPESPDYHFGIDKSVCIRWGVPLSTNDCERLGINRKYAKH